MSYSPIFRYDPSTNAALAVVAMGAVTNILMRMFTNLGNVQLWFLVAFAEGSMIANIFFHMIPEVDLNHSSCLTIIFAFFSFCLLDKVLRLFLKQEHSHSHGAKSEQDKQGEHGSKIISVILNVLADFLHNLADGVSLASEFQKGPEKGTLATLLMILHETPHQFGDYAVLIRSGMTPAAGRKAQVITASGTLIGALLYGILGETVDMDKLVTPLTVGVYLYVATVGVLPELLEVEVDLPAAQQTRQVIVQIAGVLSGVAAVCFLSHDEHQSHIYETITTSSKLEL